MANSNFPQRKIGDDFVSTIELGCMGMSPPGTTDADDEASLAVLTAAAGKSGHLTSFPNNT